MLFIGDSISGNLDITVIAKAMKAEVFASKAYSSIDDAAENEAKEKPDSLKKALLK